MMQRFSLSTFLASVAQAIGGWWSRRRASRSGSGQASVRPWKTTAHTWSYKPEPIRYRRDQQRAATAPKRRRTLEKHKRQIAHESRRRNRLVG